MYLRSLRTGEVIVEQTKSGLSHNPASNWSVDLWKTFSNWVDAAKSGHLDVHKTVFRLYVAQNYNGEFVTHLSSSLEQLDINSIVEKITSRFKVENPKGCSEYIRIFLNADPVIRNCIISNFTYESGDNDLYSELKALMNPFVSPLLVDS